MNRMTRISVAVACALGMSAALAQTVQRGDVTVSNASKPTQTVAQATTTTPIQVAQAGGAAVGATAGGGIAGIGITSTIVIVGTAAALVSISAENRQTVTHQ